MAAEIETGFLVAERRCRFACVGRDEFAFGASATSLLFQQGSLASLR
jgi:hypothetical protein